MENLSTLFSTFKTTDPPPIQTYEYKLVQDTYNDLMGNTIQDFETDLNEDLFQEQPSIQENPVSWGIQRLFDNEKSESSNYKPSTQKTINTSASKGYDAFMKNLDKYIEETGDNMTETKKKTLAKFAYLESRYNSKAKNPVSSACGYFGMIKSNRSDLGTNEQYLNNTNLQFRAASRLYDKTRSAYAPVISSAKKLGLSDFQVMYGFWFNPSSMVSFVNSGGKDNGFKDKQGTTLTKVLNNAAKLK